MKKTIAVATLMVSATSAHALMAEPGTARRVPTIKTYCLSVNEGSATKGSSLGNCDQTKENKRKRLELNANGCADGQAAFQSATLKFNSCPSNDQGGKTYCLGFYEGNAAAGSYAGTCDKTAENTRYKLELLGNKCAQGQVALVSKSVKIKSCPTFVQL